MSSFQKAGNRNFGYWNCGLGIETYYEIMILQNHNDVTWSNGKKLEIVSSTEDIFKSKVSTENVRTCQQDLKPPALSPWPEDMTKKLALEEVIWWHCLRYQNSETTTVESGLEDYCFDSHFNEELKMQPPL